MSGSTIFSGNSRYSSDFQAIIDRTVAIASLPMTQMQNVQTNLEGQSTALGSLDSKVAALQSALTSLSSGLGLNSYSTAVSDTSMVKATTADGVREGVYAIEVTDFGSFATATSKSSGAGLQKVSDPASRSISASTTFKLFLNPSSPDESINITPSANTLNALADAVNLAAPDVRAVVVNVGSSETPDYRLSIRGSQVGARSFNLEDSSGNTLLDQPVSGQGSPVKYKINGGDEVSSNSRTAILAPGLTLDLLKANPTGVSTTITVSRSGAGVSGPLSSLVSAYNAVVGEIDKHRGSSAGALQGSSLLSTVADALHRIVTYDSGSGSSISTLAALGVTFDSSTYALTFNTAAFSNATSGKLPELATFLGSSTTGGFLKAATDIMNGIEDATNGVLKAGLRSLQGQVNDQSSRIAAEQQRIDQLRTDTEARMAAADALIAALEQRATYFTNMFESMRTSGYSQ